MALEEIVQALQAAGAAHQPTRAAAEAQLKEWASAVPQFYEALLQVVALSEQAPTDVRVQAMLQFKNGLDRWRKTCPNPIPKEMKSSIRPKLLALLSEQNSTIASTLALCIGKIARLDYDSDWPDLPDALLDLIGTALATGPQGHLLLHRALMASHQTIKALAANRMPRGRKLSQQIGPKFFAPLLGLYDQLMPSIINQLQTITPSDPAQTQELAFNLDIQLLILKILRKTFAHGWAHAEEAQEPKILLQKVLDSAPQLLSARLSLFERLGPQDVQQLSQTLQSSLKCLLGMGKLFRDAPASLEHVVPPIFDFSYHLLERASASAPDALSDESDVPFPAALVVQNLVILRKLIPHFPSNDLPSKAPMTEAEVGLCQRLDQWQQDCTSLLVTRFIPMKAEDLEQWEQDPEEWMNDEEAEREDMAVRPAALKLLCVMLHHNRTSVAQCLIQLSAQPHILTPHTQADVLVKEALYAALSVNPSEVVEALGQYKPLDDWLAQDILPQLNAGDVNLKLIQRRRILALLGSWVSEEISVELKTKIYEVLSFFVQPARDHDLATRLTAARSLGNFDTWGFEESALLPYYGPIVNSMMQLIQEVHAVESRIRLMNILGLLIERMGAAIMPYAQQVLNMLPTLWAEAGEQQLFKVSILVVVTKLTEAVGSATQSIHPQLASLIAYGVTPGTADHEYLHEEAIQLWRAAVRYATVLSPELVNLLPHLTAMLGAATDMLPDLLKILVGYCLLDGQAVVSTYAANMMPAFETILGGLDADKVKVVLYAFNTVIGTSSPGSWNAALDGSGCFEKLVAPLSAEDRSPLVVSKYLGTLSRLVLASRDSFLLLVQSTSSRLGCLPQQLLALILRSWIDYHDNIGSAKHRKLAALSLAYLIQTTDETVLAHLPEFIPIWLGVLAETEETPEGDASAYSLLDAYMSDDEEFEDNQTPESMRKLQARSRDPVHCVKLVEAVATSLNVCQSLNGGQERFFRERLGGVDPLLLEELQRRLQGQLKG